MPQDENTEDSADDSALRGALSHNGFRPDSGNMQWMAAQPKILVAGACKAIRTAAERARKMVERGRG